MKRAVFLSIAGDLHASVVGQTLLEHSLDCFLDHPSLKGVVVSIAADDPY